MQRIWRKLRRNPTGLAGLVLVLGMLLLAMVGPHLAPHDPVQVNLVEKLQPPGGAYLFGTDNLGRDIFSRILAGARLTLVTSLLVVLGAAALGSLVGAVAAYVGGSVDEALMRITDTFMSIPPFLLAMVTVVALGPGLTKVGVALVLVWWPGYARLARAQVMVIVARPFVEAARSLGAGHRRLLLRHVAPNAFPTLLVQMAIDLGQVMLMSSGLSFLGLGAQRPQPEWGLMVSEGRGYMQTAWWFPTLPGAAIALAVLGFNLLGDFARDMADPRLRRQR